MAESHYSVDSARHFHPPLLTHPVDFERITDFQAEPPRPNRYDRLRTPQRLVDAAIEPSALAVGSSFLPSLSRH